jgi:DNA replication and repair protein RecF
MIVEQLELLDFRNYLEIRFDLAEGITAVRGANGQGKTNFAEALGYLATLSSFRGVTNDVLVRVGGGPAILRARIKDEQGRESLIEAEIAGSSSAAGRNRVFVNRQRLQRSRDLLGTMRVSVFSPDDLGMIKGGPAERRGFMDDVLVALAIKYDALRREVDRVLKQRNRLLKQIGGKQIGGKQSGGCADADALGTLDVWDAQFSELGDRFARARSEMVRRVEPYVAEAYRDLATSGSRSGEVQLGYHPSWGDRPLIEVVTEQRAEDLRRQISTVGPHRDDLELAINQMPARTHASQGEQRCLALALKLGAHRLVAEHVGSVPVLVLDDVLSELDPDRAAALLRSVPPGQVIITSAVPLPESALPDRVIWIEAGTVVASPYEPSPCESGASEPGPCEPGAHDPGPPEPVSGLSD